MRNIEYYRLWADGRWDTDFIAIPANTPEDKIEQAVRDAVSQLVLSHELTMPWRSGMKPALVATGVYHIPELER